jgi:hypothetical protein
MRKLVFGGIGVVWGGAVLVYSFSGGGPRGGGGAYGAGQTAGTVFGGLLFVVGLIYCILGLVSLGSAKGKRKRKQKKRQRTDYEDE